MAQQVTCPSGRVLEFDLNRVTVREFRALFVPEQAQAEEDTTLAKAFGLTAEELLDLSQPDYRQVVKTFFEAAKAPLDDPKV